MPPTAEHYANKYFFSLSRLCLSVCVCSEDDWEKSHLAKLDREGISLPGGGLHHDDAILGAMPIATATAENGGHTPNTSAMVEVSSY